MRFILTLAITLLSAAPVLAGEQAPPWLQQAAAMTLPAYDKDVDAVVLVDDGTVTVNEDGRVTKTHNYAIRILRREGRDYAYSRVGYIPESGKVKEMNAWLISSDGKVKKYGKDETLDLAAAPNDVYNEYRVRRISARDDTDAGMVFGFTHVSEDRSIFSQDDWTFQSSLPVINSRYTLVLPKSWRAESVTFNYSKIAPTVNGSTYIWQLSHLPAVPDEPLGPSMSNMVARLAVSYFPPAATSAPGIKTFANWAEVAAWMAELEDSQVTISEPLKAKALELTANAKTELEKIQAIGRYVQRVQYISIQTGLGRGGGYKPRLSTEVFEKSYGDCKDKANLMRAMLKVVGIDAIPVSIYSGDPDYVRPDWPSPQQFNHCIIAVRVSDETQSPTVIQHAKLGRLLIFDPTAETTPVGDLPAYLQGSLALIDSKESDSLVKMPVTPPDMNQLFRTAEVQLGSDGSVSGAIEERAGGQIAARFRTQFRQLSRSDYSTMVQRGSVLACRARQCPRLSPLMMPTTENLRLSVAFAAPVLMHS